jgi:hypothetical protein
MSTFFQAIRFFLILLSVGGVHLIKTTNLFSEQEGTISRHIWGKSFVEPRASDDLLSPDFQLLGLGHIKPLGWLRNQLHIQAEGLSGHLDEIWPDVAWSQWIGGTMEGWERGPYWLDGVVGLAYQLNEKWLTDKVEHWFDHIFATQQPNGMLGPLYPNGNLGIGQYPANDSWPVTIVLKAMTQYYEATGDPRVFPCMQRFFAFLDVLLDKTPLFMWAKYRWQDLLLSIHWLYERTQDSKLLALGAKIYSQGYNWTQWYMTFPCRVKFNPTLCGTDELAVHGVNNAQALKAPAVWYRQSKRISDRDGFLEYLNKLIEYHGTSAGVFSADELLAGLMPSQGTELCLVVEMMLSLSVGASILGMQNPRSIGVYDRLEQVAYNALAGGLDSKMWTHQYVQQANQVQCKYSQPNVYVDDGPQSNMFGIAPNYGCCTANFNQGWPKFVAQLWLKNEQRNQLIAGTYGPCAVATTLQDVSISLQEITNYPFEDTVTVHFSVDRTANFSLCFRIPSWSSNASVVINEYEKIQTEIQPGSWWCTPPSINRWMKGKVYKIVLSFVNKPYIVRRYNNSAAFYKGPLLFSLRIGENWVGVDENALLYEVYNTTKWNYAVDIHKGIKFSYRVPFPEECPFCTDSPPISATVYGRELPSWGLERNAAAPPPRSPVVSNQPLVPLTLVPYGNTRLRISEFPVLT